MLLAALSLAWGKPVWWVTRNVTPAEFRFWAAVFERTPFGPRADDLRAGIVAAVTANAFGGGKATPATFFKHLKPAPARGCDAFRAFALRQAGRTPKPRT